MPDLLSAAEVTYYRELYEDFLANRIDASRYRSDLGSHVDKDGAEKKERITQIMVPGRILPQLLERPLHRKALQLAKQLMGDDYARIFLQVKGRSPGMRC